MESQRNQNRSAFEFVLKAISFAVALAVMASAGKAGATPIAPGDPDDCLIYPDAIATPPRFEDYPASTSPAVKTVRPRLTSGEARRFRTVIRESVARGPNFAGHFAIVQWGCGAACLDSAIVDTLSGKVMFDPKIRDVFTGHVGVNEVRSYQLDSRLLVIAGMPQEQESRDGLTYFEWTGSRLKLLRFVLRAQACRQFPK